MKKLMTIILLTATIAAFGQNQDNYSEWRVINMLGANVYESPTFESDVLSDLAIGTTIQIEKTIETEELNRIEDNFYLSGLWVKPSGVNGYIFSSDLTDKSVDIGPNEYGQIKMNLRGKLISEISDKKFIKTENGEFPQYIEIKIYEKGTYTYTVWDDCFNHLDEFVNFTLSEVYHQMISDYYGTINENELWIPIFDEKSENTYRFDGEGATQDLRIVVRENGLIIVASYDCT